MSMQSILIGENDRWKIRKSLQDESYALTYALGRVTIYLMNETEKEYFVQQLRQAKESWDRYKQMDCWISNQYVQVLLLKEDLDFLINVLTQKVKETIIQ